MVRALISCWERLGAHPRGRWLRLALEVAWYVALVLLVREMWDAPQIYFGYMKL